MSEFAQTFLYKTKDVFVDLGSRIIFEQNATGVPVAAVQPASRRATY